MAAIFGTHPPFHICTGYVNDYINFRLIDESQGSLLQMTIFDAELYWKDAKKPVLYSYVPFEDVNFPAIYFPSARKNLYALQLHSNGFESLIYFQLTNPANPKLTLQVITDQHGNLELLDTATYRILTPQQVQTLVK